MRVLNKLLLYIAHLFRFLHLPHALKYGLFLTMKGKTIPVRARIDISGAIIDLNLGDFIEYWLFMDGLYEEAWIAKIKDFVEGKLFIDVGAHIGCYPLSLFKEAKHIFTFEPEENNYKRLVHNLKINSISNVKALRKAVTDKNGRARLYIHKVESGWHSLYVKYSSTTEEVQTVSLDSFIERKHLGNIGLIKIDVEGAELSVLKGVEKTLRKFHPAILVEFNRPLAELAGQSLFDIYDLVFRKNYKAYRLAKNSLKLVKRSDISKVYNENILFIHK